MADGVAMRVAFISSFLPQRCGIATFTSDLIMSLRAAAAGRFEPLVVAVAGDEKCQFTDPVRFEIRRNVKNDYICAADYLNYSHVDLVSLQHEFGLFGGSAGSDLTLLLRRVNTPVITTLHTVLDDPTEEYYRATVDVCELSDRIIVMNERGIDMLCNIYGVDARKIGLIPHGIPDLPFVDSNYYKHRFQMDGRRTILTFGLLSKNKGIEVMLQALPRIIELDPTVLYIVLGATHPGVLRHEGEAYRFRLQQMVKDLGLEKHVTFYNRFVSDERLHDFLCAADLYVTPYRNREQLTSGTLAFAVGTGKAVISTPYWAAEELLADGRGKLVEFDDPDALATAIIEVLRDERLFYAMRRRAYDYGRSRTWPKVGEQYWELFLEKPLRCLAQPRPLCTPGTFSNLEVPEPALDHLRRLTDDTGLLQHAKFTMPDRDHGYCTDDNARAVVAMVRYYAQYGDPEALRLLDIYLSFIHHAQRPDGTVRNFMGYDRQWWEEEPPHDALGRTLWALGAIMSDPPVPQCLPIIKDCFDRSVRHVPVLSPRGRAYALFGMADYLRQFPGASDIKRYFALAADSLLWQFEQCHDARWLWFEDTLSYDNAALPQAMFVAAHVTGETKYLDVARQTCQFLLDNTMQDGHFSFIGCDGWYPRGGERAAFDQQPIEAVGTVLMLRAAYEATGEIQWLRLQRLAFDWLLGRNDLGIPLYDFRTKGCADGLHRTGVSLNQGAESLVSFLLSLLHVVESSHHAEPKALEQTESSPTEAPSVMHRIRELRERTDSDEAVPEELP